MTTSLLLPEGNLHPVLVKEESSKAGTTNMGDEQGSFSSRDEFDGFLQKNNSDSPGSDAGADPVTKEEMEADNNQQQEQEEELDDNYDILEAGGNGLVANSGESSMEASVTSTTDFDNSLLGSGDLPEEHVHMNKADKADVRRSILKGKSELSKSRQKNHANKKGEQGGSGSGSGSGAPPASSSSTHVNPNGKSHTGSRKMAATAHVPSSSSTNKQSLDRPRSHDDIDALKESNPRRRLTSSRVLGEEDSKKELNNSSSGDSIGKRPTTRGIPKRTKSTQVVKRSLSSRVLPGRVKSLEGAVNKEDLLKRSASSRVLPGRGNSLDVVPSKEDILLASQPPPALTSRSQSTGDTAWEKMMEVDGSGFPADKEHNNDTSVEFDSFPEKITAGDAEAEGSWAPFPADQEGFPTGAEKSVSRRSTTSSNGHSNGKHHDSSDDVMDAFSGGVFAETETSNRARQNSADYNNSAAGEKMNVSHAESSSSFQTSPKKKEEEIALWTCWGCEYRNNAMDHLFCGMCGTGRDWVCPSCDHENKSSFNFCGMCGGRKGRMILHKDQPEEFDMMVRMTKQSHRALRKMISNNSQSSSSPPPPSPSVASARSANRRPSTASKPPRLATDEMSLGAKSRSGGSSVDGRQYKDEKRSNRDRGRGRDSQTMKKSQGRTRSSERGGRDDGKERKSRGSTVNGDGKKERKSEKKDRKSRNPDKVRRPRDASSVPPAERKNVVQDGAFARFAHEQPELKRTYSLSVMDPGEENKSNNSYRIDGDDDPKKKSASLLSKKGGMKTRRKSEENEKILGGAEVNATDQSLWRPADPEGSPRNSVNAEERHSMSGILATPSIKKRFLKMGGKVGGKLFKPTDLPMMHVEDDANNEPARFAEITVSKGPTSSDKPEVKGADVPPTPSLKKRLLGKISWGKSEHGKPSSGPPMMGAPMLDMMGETEDVDPGNEKEPEKEEEEDESSETDDPLEGLSQGLVVTAKDMRPNRPGTNARRKPPNRVRSDMRGNRRSSHHGGPSERPERPERPGAKSRLPRRTQSSDGNPSRKPGRGDRRGAHRTNEDPLDLSEAESIESTGL